MSNRLRITSPIDGSVYAERDWADDATVKSAISSAAAAQRVWRATSLDERIRILGAAVERLLARSDVIVEELSWQMGRPINAGGGELAGFNERARHMLSIAPECLQDQVQPPKAGFQRWIRREPLGLVFTIAPWNFPYMTAVNSVWPALAAGNAVILKHAQQTILCGERLAEALREAGLPAGLFQALPLTHDTAARLIQHEETRMVCFTGSVRGGRSVMRAVADGSGFPATGLELGGKDPAYVRADADIDHAAVGLADGAFFNSGQSCCSIERVYVDATVFDAFIERLVAETQQLRLGNPLARDTTLGPLVNQAAADSIREQVQEAVTAGAQPLINPDDYSMAGGAYLPPQILINVDHSMRVMTEESFGPIIGVMPVSGDDEAIRLMNDSEYGLTAAIWTADAAAAASLGDRLETGTVFMNRCDYLDPALAWTGVGRTGRGCTLSALGYEHLTRPKSFHLRIAT